MTEQQEQQPVILTIDDQEYDVNELGNEEVEPEVDAG